MTQQPSLIPPSREGGEYVTWKIPREGMGFYTHADETIFYSHAEETSSLLEHRLDSRNNTTSARLVHD